MDKSPEKQTTKTNQEVIEKLNTPFPLSQVAQDQMASLINVLYTECLKELTPIFFKKINKTRKGDTS